MKHSIYLKYLIGYLVFSVLMILGINYIVEPVIKDIEVKQLGESIYKEAYSLSQKYGKYNYDFPLTVLKLWMKYLLLPFLLTLLYG